MKLPRNLSGNKLAKKLNILGYKITRQTGSHLRLTTFEYGEHHITIPKHNALNVGTLAAVLVDIAKHFKTSREELIEKLF